MKKIIYNLPPLKKIDFSESLVDLLKNKEKSLIIFSLEEK